MLTAGGTFPLSFIRTRNVESPRGRALGFCSEQDREVPGLMERSSE